MGACTDMSVILKTVESDANSRDQYRLKKLTICKRCRVCFVKKKTYDEHTSWCKGTNSQHFLFPQQDLQTFEEFIPCRETPRATIYYDLETSTSKEELKVISCSYVVAFREDLDLPPIIVYRSAMMDTVELTSTSMPSEIEGMMDDDDVEKLDMCAHDVREHPHAMTQMMTMEMVSIQRAITRAMFERTFYHGSLQRRVRLDSMEGYLLTKCYLCGFDLDNDAATPVPFRESVEFWLRKLYMKEYCQTTHQEVLVDKSNAEEEWSEEKFVSVWLEAMEKINTDRSRFTNA